MSPVDDDLGAALAATHVPHWMGTADSAPVELLTLFGAQGERAHLRARTRPDEG